jgi:hypothetical protein
MLSIGQDTSFIIRVINYLVDGLPVKINEFIEEHPKVSCMDLWEEIQFDVLDAETGEEAYLKLRDFEFNGFSFRDSWEWDLKEYTYHYIWNCYAIAWAIKQYDNLKDVK